MNQKQEEKIAYIQYCRKSSEAEDRQALSNESQMTENARTAEQHGIRMSDIEILTESKSAKNPFGRPIFEQLYKSIDTGKTQGIIAWHANRLSRNAIDAARLVDLFDKGKLLKIITQQQVFRNTPQDKFMLTLFCSQAKMENDNKSIDVKRGLRKKYEMGIPPGLAPAGYINDYGKKGDTKILPDPERFGLVQQLFELFLSGKYSVRQLLKYSDETLGLRTIQREKEGGKSLKLSRLYDMLKNPLFAGFFYGKDENDTMKRWEAHSMITPMITENQFWQIQAMLGRKSRPRPSVNKLSFAYTGRTKCGACDGAVTAEHKYQLICPACRFKFSYRSKKNCPKCDIAIEQMENPTYLHYIYYHCTKKRDPNCTERSVWEEDIDKTLASYYETSLKISPDLRDWCLKHIDELDKNDKQNEYEAKLSLEKAINKAEREFDGLVDMKSKGLLEDDDFIRLQTAKKAEMIKLRESLSEYGNINPEATKRIAKAFELAVGVAEVFKNGSFEDKQQALSDTRSNLTLKDKTISIYHDELLSIIIRGRLAAKSESKRFEPEKWEANKGKTPPFSDVCPSWLGEINIVRPMRDIKYLSFFICHKNPFLKSAYPYRTTCSYESGIRIFLYHLNNTLSSS